MLSRVTAIRDDPAPPVFTPPPGNPRFPLFDSVRGIAALMVVVTHAGLLSGANHGAAYGPYVARLEMVGTPTPVPNAPSYVENALRGQWIISCDKGNLLASITLTADGEPVATDPW